MNDLTGGAKLGGGVFAQSSQGGPLLLVEDGQTFGQADLRAAGRYADAVLLTKAREDLRRDMRAGGIAVPDRPRQCQAIPDLPPIGREPG